MNAMGEFDISHIIGTLYRRKGLIVAVFVVVSSLAAYLAATLPNVYQSNALILVTPQRVPSSFVTSTVTIDLNERMQSIVQEILSRTQLEKIVQEFNLYSSDGEQAALLEGRIERLRKTVKVELRRNNVFQLSYESESPEKAQQVVSRLASFFIEQNLQVREQQALGTTSFINAEAERLRKELEEQEAVVNRYKAANRYELPDQLDANLRSLDQLRRELDAGTQRMTALQERKGILQKQLVESDILGMDLLGGSFLQGGDIGAQTGAQNVQVQVKKKELDSLLQRYSQRHPDVARLKKEIQALEAIKNTSAPASSGAVPKEPAVNPLKQVLQTQIADIDAEIQALRSQHDRIRSQIGTLQARVDNSSIHGIELAKISRDYEITLKKYQDLLAKSLESELSENMEKKQKGEQFQIADPANFPLKPVRPNRWMIVLIGLLLGLGAGAGLALVWDNVDTSFKRSEDLISYVNLPLLATIPASPTRGSVLEQRRAQGILVFASIGALAFGIVCIRIFGPMYF
jgi:polysaccharide chain length determinant protein (PEP-CTERM system associated)